MILTGFPWVASGYAQVDSPLAGLAPWLGVYGIGAVVARARRRLRLLAAARGARLAGAGRRRSSSPLVAGALLGRIDFTTPTRALTISLLQGNVPQQEKFAPQYLPKAASTATAAQLAAARGELVVGPETVIPVLLERARRRLLDALAARFRVPGPGRDPRRADGRPRARLHQLGARPVGGATAMPGGFYRYDKHHLVPFGEFVPTGFHWFTRMMNIPLGDFNRGPLTAPSFDVDGERVAPNICYEDLFGEELAARFVPGARRRRSSPT